MRCSRRSGFAIVLWALLAQGCGDKGSAAPSCAALFTQPENSGAEVTLQDGVTEIAQSFQLATAGRPVNLQLRLKPVGTPSGTLIAKIEGDASGQPDSITLETATLDATTIRPDPAVQGDTGERYYLFTFPSPGAPLEAKTTYWIRLKGSTNFTSSAAVSWMGNNTGAYTGGAAKSASDGTHFTGGVIGSLRAFLFMLGC